MSESSFFIMWRFISGVGIGIEFIPGAVQLQLLIVEIILGNPRFDDE